jgi:hypothetical protein
MKTTLKITFPGKGVPGKMLDGIDRALDAYYADTPMARACASAGASPPRFWETEIELVPEDAEDEREADRIAGRDG